MCKLEFWKGVKHPVLEKVNLFNESAQFQGQTAQLQFCIRRMSRGRFGVRKYISRRYIGSGLCRGTMHFRNQYFFHAK